jgi:hypothetical protein
MPLAGILLLRIMYIMLNSAMSSLAVRPVARVSYTHKQGLLWAPGNSSVSAAQLPTASCCAGLTELYQ